MDGSKLELPPRPKIELKENVSYSSIYRSLEEMGRGRFGTVAKCERKEDKLLLAAKFIKKTRESKKEALHEIDMMNRLHHLRIISLFDAFETPKELVLVLELVTGGELFERVIGDDYLSEDQVICYTIQIIQAIQHMHKQNMVHLDLKPENILCVDGGVPGFEKIKLIDFGLAKVLKKGEPLCIACGTAEFIAPEVINFEPITMAADMWSLGVIVYVLISGLSPFADEDDQATLANVRAGEYDFEDEDEIFDTVSRSAINFIESLLVLDHTKRLTADECLQHKWFKSDRTDNKVETENLKHYVEERRWKKAFNVIKAYNRFVGVWSEVVKDMRAAVSRDAGEPDTMIPEEPEELPSVNGTITSEAPEDASGERVDDDKTSTPEIAKEPISSNESKHNDVGNEESDKAALGGKTTNKAGIKESEVVSTEVSKDISIQKPETDTGVVSETKTDEVIAPETTEKETLPPKKPSVESNEPAVPVVVENGVVSTSAHEVEANKAEKKVSDGKPADASEIKTIEKIPPIKNTDDKETISASITQNGPIKQSVMPTTEENKPLPTVSTNASTHAASNTSTPAANNTTPPAANNTSTPAASNTSTPAANNTSTPAASNTSTPATSPTKPRRQFGAKKVKQKQDFIILEPKKVNKPTAGDGGDAPKRKNFGLGRKKKANANNATIETAQKFANNDATGARKNFDVSGKRKKVTYARKNENAAKVLNVKKKDEPTKAGTEETPDK